MSFSVPENPLEKAKKYSRIKYATSLFGTVYFLLLLFIFITSGLSSDSLTIVSKLAGASWLELPAYLLFLFLAFSLLDLPLTLYRSFFLERRFSLSTQKFGAWVIDQIKSGILSYLFSLILLGVFYFVLGAFPGGWWLVISLFWIFFSLVLTKVLPVVIIPLFFKYKKLSDESLKERIFKLAGKMKVVLLDVFEIDFSKKTLKANAAFVGTGRTRRVILADTLKDKYTSDEIEAILAHEFAHCKLRHLSKLMCINSFVIAILFFIIYCTSAPVLEYFGFSSLSQLSALPVASIYFTLFGLVTSPLENGVSRVFEKDADRLALEVTGMPAAFISMMEKLAAQNLADRNPHPIIKFFFFDHPSIDERIAYARWYANNA